MSTVFLNATRDSLLALVLAGSRCSHSFLIPLPSVTAVPISRACVNHSSLWGVILKSFIQPYTIDGPFLCPLMALHLLYTINVILFCLDTLKYNFLEEGALFGSFKCLPPLAQPKSSPTCHAAGVMQMLTEFRPSSICGQPETLTGSVVHGSARKSRAAWESCSSVILGELERHH